MSDANYPSDDCLDAYNAEGKVIELEKQLTDCKKFITELMGVVESGRMSRGGRLGSPDECVIKISGGEKSNLIMRGYKIINGGTGQ